MTPSERLKEIEDSPNYPSSKDFNWLIARVKRLTEAGLNYKSECENPVPDALHKRNCRDKLFRVLEGDE